MAVWAIDGATSPASAARTANFVAVKGEEGIILPTDHQVTAVTPAGAAVLVSPGGTSLKNMYVEGAQNYFTGDAGAVTVPVPATGSSGGAVRYVIKTVRDPKYAGVTLDQRGYDFFDVVDSNDLVTYGHPYYAFARIDQPASTATITDGSEGTLNMITDLRSLANPQQVRGLLTIYPTANHSVPTGGYSSWPILAAQRPLLDVPEWATRLDVVAHFSGVQFIGSSETVAGIRSGFGAEGSENGILIADTPGRGHYTVVGSHSVSAAQRGTTQVLNLQAVRSRGTGVWEADYQTSIAIDYQFTAVPV